MEGQVFVSVFILIVFVVLAATARYLPLDSRKRTLRRQRMRDETTERKRVELHRIAQQANWSGDRFG